MTPNQTAREKRVDEILAAEQAARAAESRSAIHTRLVEEERRAAEAEEHAKLSAARASFIERAEVAYPEACLEYKKTVDAFREARLKLWALDVILSHSGGFSDHNMAVELRHARAAPDERDLHHDFGDAIAAMRKALGA